jgi:hypothetical protein
MISESQIRDARPVLRLKNFQSRRSEISRPINGILQRKRIQAEFLPNPSGLGLKGRSPELQNGIQFVQKPAVPNTGAPEIPAPAPS